MKVEIKAPVELAQEFKEKIHEYRKAANKSNEQVGQHISLNLAIKLVVESKKVAPDDSYFDSLPTLRNWKINERKNGRPIMPRTIGVSKEEKKYRVMLIIKERKFHKKALMHGWAGCIKILKNGFHSETSDFGSVDISKHPLAGVTITLTNRYPKSAEISDRLGVTAKAIRNVISDMDVYIKRKMGEAVHKAVTHKG